MPGPAKSLGKKKKVVVTAATPSSSNREELISLALAGLTSTSSPSSSSGLDETIKLIRPTSKANLIYVQRFQQGLKELQDLFGKEAVSYLTGEDPTAGGLITYLDGGSQVKINVPSEMKQHFIDHEARGQVALLKFLRDDDDDDVKDDPLYVFALTIQKWLPLLDPDTFVSLEMQKSNLNMMFTLRETNDILAALSDGICQGRDALLQKKTPTMSREAFYTLLEEANEAIARAVGILDELKARQHAQNMGVDYDKFKRFIQERRVKEALHLETSSSPSSKGGAAAAAYVTEILDDEDERFMFVGGNGGEGNTNTNLNQRTFNQGASRAQVAFTAIGDQIMSYRLPQPGELDSMSQAIIDRHLNTDMIQEVNTGKPSLQLDSEHQNKPRMSMYFNQAELDTAKSLAGFKSKSETGGDVRNDMTDFCEDRVENKKKYTVCTIPHGDLNVVYTVQQSSGDSTFELLPNKSPNDHYDSGMKASTISELLTKPRDIGHYIWTTGQQLIKRGVVLGIWGAVYGADYVSGKAPGATKETMKSWTNTYQLENPYFNVDKNLVDKKIDSRQLMVYLSLNSDAIVKEVGLNILVLQEKLVVATRTVDRIEKQGRGGSDFNSLSHEKESVAQLRSHIRDSEAQRLDILFKDNMPSSSVVMGRFSVPHSWGGFVLDVLQPRLERWTKRYADQRAHFEDWTIFKGISVPVDVDAKGEGDNGLLPLSLEEFTNTRQMYDELVDIVQLYMRGLGFAKNTEVLNGITYEQFIYSNPYLFNFDVSIFNTFYTTQALYNRVMASLEVFDAKRQASFYKSTYNLTDLENDDGGGSQMTLFKLFDNTKLSWDEVKTCEGIGLGSWPISEKTKEMRNPDSNSKTSTAFTITNHIGIVGLESLMKNLFPYENASQEISEVDYNKYLSKRVKDYQKNRGEDNVGMIISDICGGLFEQTILAAMSNGRKILGVTQKDRSNGSTFLFLVTTPLQRGKIWNAITTAGGLLVTTPAPLAGIQAQFVKPDPQMIEIKTLGGDSHPRVEYPKDYIARLGDRFSQEIPQQQQPLLNTAVNKVFVFPVDPKLMMSEYVDAHRKVSNTVYAESRSLGLEVEKVMHNLWVWTDMMSIVDTYIKEDISVYPLVRLRSLASTRFEHVPTGDASDLLLHKYDLSILSPDDYLDEGVPETTKHLLKRLTASRNADRSKVNAEVKVRLDAYNKWVTLHKTLKLGLKNLLDVSQQIVADLNAPENDARFVRLTELSDDFLRLTKPITEIMFTTWLEGKIPPEDEAYYRGIANFYSILIQPSPGPKGGDDNDNDNDKVKKWKLRKKIIAEVLKGRELGALVKRIGTSLTSLSKSKYALSASTKKLTINDTVRKTINEELHTLDGIIDAILTDSESPFQTTTTTTTNSTSPVLYDGTITTSHVDQTLYRLLKDPNVTLDTIIEKQEDMLVSLNDLVKFLQQKQAYLLLRGGDDESNLKTVTVELHRATVMRSNIESRRRHNQEDEDEDFKNFKSFVNRIKYLQGLTQAVIDSMELKIVEREITKRNVVMALFLERFDTAPWHRTLKVAFDEVRFKTDEMCARHVFKPVPHDTTPSLLVGTNGSGGSGGGDPKNRVAMPPPEMTMSYVMRVGTTEKCFSFIQSSVTDYPKNYFSRPSNVRYQGSMGYTGDTPLFVIARGEDDMAMCSNVLYIPNKDDPSNDSLVHVRSVDAQGKEEWVWITYGTITKLMYIHDERGLNPSRFSQTLTGDELETETKRRKRVRNYPKQDQGSNSGTRTGTGTGGKNEKETKAVVVDEEEEKRKKLEQKAMDEKKLELEAKNEGKKGQEQTPTSDGVKVIEIPITPEGKKGQEQTPTSDGVKVTEIPITPGGKNQQTRLTNPQHNNNNTNGTTIKKGIETGFHDAPYRETSNGRGLFKEKAAEDRVKPKDTTKPKGAAKTDGSEFDNIDEGSNESSSSDDTQGPIPKNETPKERKVREDEAENETRRRIAANLLRPDGVITGEDGTGNGNGFTPNGPFNNPQPHSQKKSSSASPPPKMGQSTLSRLNPASSHFHNWVSDNGLMLGLFPSHGVLLWLIACFFGLKNKKKNGVRDKLLKNIPRSWQIFAEDIELVLEYAIFYYLRYGKMMPISDFMTAASLKLATWMTDVTLKEAPKGSKLAGFYALIMPALCLVNYAYERDSIQSILYIHVPMVATSIGLRRVVRTRYDRDYLINDYERCHTFDHIPWIKEDGVDDLILLFRKFFEKPWRRFKLMPTLVSSSSASGTATPSPSTSLVIAPSSSGASGVLQRVAKTLTLTGRASQSIYHSQLVLTSYKDDYINKFLMEIFPPFTRTVTVHILTTTTTTTTTATTPPSLVSYDRGLLPLVTKGGRLPFVYIDPVTKVLVEVAHDTLLRIPSDTEPFNFMNLFYIALPPSTVVTKHTDVRSLALFGTKYREQYESEREYLSDEYADEAPHESTKFVFADPANSNNSSMVQLCAPSGPLHYLFFVMPKEYPLKELAAAATTVGSTDLPIQKATWKATSLRANTELNVGSIFGVLSGLAPECFPLNQFNANFFAQHLVPQLKQSTPIDDYTTKLTEWLKKVHERMYETMSSGFDVVAPPAKPSGTTTTKGATKTLAGAASAGAITTTYTYTGPPIHETPVSYISWILQVREVIVKALLLLPCDVQMTKYKKRLRGPVGGGEMDPSSSSPFPRVPIDISPNSEIDELNELPLLAEIEASKDFSKSKALWSALHRFIRRLVEKVTIAASDLIAHYKNPLNLPVYDPLQPDLHGKILNSALCIWHLADAQSKLEICGAQCLFVLQMVNIHSDMQDLFKEHRKATTVTTKSDRKLDGTPKRLYEHAINAWFPLPNCVYSREKAIKSAKQGLIAIAQTVLSHNQVVDCDYVRNQLASRDLYNITIPGLLGQARHWDHLDHIENEDKSPHVLTMALLIKKFITLSVLIKDHNSHLARNHFPLGPDYIFGAGHAHVGIDEWLKENCTDDQLLSFVGDGYFP